MSRERDIEAAEELLNEETGKIRNKRKIDRVIISTIALAWALFQFALPKFIILDSVMVRSIHLAFALTLVFLTIPISKHNRRIKFLHAVDRIPVIDFILAVLAAVAALYIMLDWGGISVRAGRPILRDVVMSIVLVILLLEASRRVLGPALGVIAIIFSLYAFYGPYMPSFLAFRGASLTKYLSQIVLSTEGIYGIPLDVSATTVFLFVLLGSMLEKVGGGNFFNDISISLLGRYKGGPAKASVVSSGLTGLVSGSSIANVVTTGTFTIPLMKKVGYPGKIAAATEVAASTNGQLMPPIMGAAAFIIAEYLNMPYLDVIKAAAIPAFVSYFALFYITHLEASSLGMKGLPPEDIPRTRDVVRKGFHFLIPLGMLVYELVVLRHSPELAAFNAIVVLMAIVFILQIVQAVRTKSSIPAALWDGVKVIADGMKAGSRNMLSVAIATATAGIIVGIVTMGIGSMIVQIVEFLSVGNIFLLLVITAIASLILGMGLPTTATYIVMASITVPVIVKLSVRFGADPIPAIAAHLFCFYFGILADDTPPVGLAAYTAAAIAKSDPIPTGIQGFIYDLRTAVIPFMFILNPELVLVRVDNLPQAVLIFGMAILGAFAFTNAVQGWFIIRTRWYEVPLYLGAALVFFYPALPGKLFGIPYEYRYYMYGLAIILYAGAYLIQKLRMRTPAVV